MNKQTKKDQCFDLLLFPADKSLFSVVFYWILDTAVIKVSLYLNGLAEMAVEWLKVKGLKNGWLQEGRLGWCFSWPSSSMPFRMYNRKGEFQCHKGSAFAELWAEAQIEEQVPKITESVGWGDRINIHTYLPQTMEEDLKPLPMVTNESFLL